MDALFHKAVDAKAKRQSQGDIRCLAGHKRQPDNGDEGHANRCRLRLVERFLQEDDAERHRNKRVDEVAQRGVGNMPGVNRNDVSAPVDRNGDTTREHPSPRACAKRP